MVKWLITSGRTLGDVVGRLKRDYKVLNKVIAAGIKVSPSMFSRWKKDSLPSSAMRKNMTNLVSSYLNHPYQELLLHDLSDSELSNDELSAGE